MCSVGNICGKDVTRLNLGFCNPTFESLNHYINQQTALHCIFTCRFQYLLRINWNCGTLVYSTVSVKINNSLKKKSSYSDRQWFTDIYFHMVYSYYVSAGLILHGGNEGDCLRVPRSLPWCPAKCYSTNLQFHHRVPFTKKKMPWCPCPSKNEAYSPVSVCRKRNNVHPWSTI